MRVVVTGATGNVGTSLLAALAREERVESVLGLARRLPELSLPKTEWAAADVARDDLVPLFEGADCVVHLAWLIQPARDQSTLELVNVEGSERVFRAAAAARVPALVHASSVGAYSPGPKDRPVDEEWLTGGVRSAYYARQKAHVERLLDRLERDFPGMRVVRLRPALIFKREAASGIRRLFAGPFLPSPLVRRALIPIVPKADRLVFQAVHADDVGEAYRLAIVGEARGAFNVAAEPVLDPAALSKALGARAVPVRVGALRRLIDLSWRMRLQPTDSSWLDMGLGVPLMDVSRARAELGWEPARGADEALLDLLEGIRDRVGYATPPLASGTGGPLRLGELITGVGGRP